MSITINKQTDKFFISINKQGVHSFVMLGVYDQNKAKHLLCRVGKFGDNEDKDPNCALVTKFLCNALFYKNKAKLGDEGVTRTKKGSTPITYQAYDITYAQYLEFIQTLESLQTDDNKFLCYKPVATNDNEITFELSNNLSFPPQPEHRIKKNVTELHVGNTCRHSAIALVEATQHAPVASLISSHFLTSLPYKTVLDYGKPSDDIPFYVLPAPPAAFSELGNAETKIITKLYQRMEHMLLLEPNSQSTQDKFLRLKELYLNIIGPQKKLSLTELLKSIQTWKQDNELILTSLRKKYFWDSFFTRKSATMSLIEEVERDLQVAQKGHCHS
ncbi:hypothetical protein Lgra_2501 [Legionella gratiana]|uniref:Uncharacterized protein n=1 Tax=Legionella gratiana TaxID=45066 RepID=A0A378JEQ8_9GAMM|nr:hypothetical protein [Legionella gratiana]KTD09266.1 hypothetical protein Lgra_2501 [Legionella gratiana]STX45481.1 Uncharacterised protein [Legionella gratiana]